MNKLDESDYTFTRDMIIKSVARRCNESVFVVRDVYRALEEELLEMLSSANKEKNVSVKLFEGINIKSVYVPEKKKVNNLTGKVIRTIEKIKPKANITRSYCEKISARSK